MFCVALTSRCRMVRIGTWAESRITFAETTTGKRGVRRSPSGLGNYVKLYAGKVPAPASSTAGTGGSVRVLKATHGLDTIIGAVAVTHNWVPPTSIGVSVINASTLRLAVAGYTAATQSFDVLIWGTSSA